MHRTAAVVLLAVGATALAACAAGTDTQTGDASASAGTAATAESPVTTPAPPVAGEPRAGLELPATFDGMLPCADCPGVRHRLNLWPDGVFHLQRNWLGGDRTESELGRWRRDPARGAIVLHGEGESALRFKVEGPQTLRWLDTGEPGLHGSHSRRLSSDGQLTPLDLELALRGLFTYLADAPRFEECLTGRSYPVAMEDDYIRLERAYLAAEKPAPGAPMLAAIDGRITERPAMEGDRSIPTIVVRRFVSLFPDQSCDKVMSEASLFNTYWRIVLLGDEPVPAIEGRSEPRLVLDRSEQRYSATVGCNRIAGRWELDGERLRFSEGASTRMACPPPLDAREERLQRVLADTESWRINGQVLELFDRTGTSLAVFEAVYIP